MKYKGSNFSFYQGFNNVTNKISKTQLETWIDSNIDDLKKAKETNKKVYQESLSVRRSISFDKKTNRFWITEFKKG